MGGSARLRFRGTRGIFTNLRKRTDQPASGAATAAR